MKYFELKKVGENDRAIFYENNSTRRFSNNNKGIKCLLAKQKNTGHKEFILIRNNEYIYSSQKLEDIGLHLEILKKCSQ